MPAPRSSGSISSRHTAYWPCPPDCLTRRPCATVGWMNVSRNDICTGSVSTSTCQFSFKEVSSLSTCAWPIAHKTIWWVSALWVSRRVTSSATRRCRAEASFSSSPRVVARIATGRSGSGSSQGSMSAGRAVPERVSAVSAVWSLETRTRSPAMAHRFRAGLVTERRGHRSGSLAVDVVVDVAVGGVRGEALEMAGDVQRGVRAESAGEDPDQREPAHELVARGAHHLGDERAVGIAGQFAEGLTVGGVHRRNRRDGGGRKPVLEQVVELLDPHPGGRMGRDDRKEAGGPDRRLQVGGDDLDVDLLARQMPFQQVLVLGLLDDRLHQGVAAVLDQGGLRRVGLAHDRRTVGIVDHGAAEQVDRPGDPAAGVQRKPQRLRIAEISLATTHRFVEVGASVLEPAHRHRAGYTDRVAFPPEQAGRFVDLLVGGNDEQNRVRASESGPHLSDEILVTRCVEQVDHQTPAHH